MNQHEGKIVTIGIAATESIVVATVVVCDMDGSNVEASPIILTKSTPSRNYKEIIAVQETIEKGLKSSICIIIDTHGIGGCFYEGLKDRTHRVYAEDLRGPCSETQSNRFLNKAAQIAYPLRYRGNFKNALSVNDNGQWYLPVGTLHEDAFFRSVIAAYTNPLGYIVDNKQEAVNPHDHTKEFYAKQDEYIEIKGDGYYIKFKASDLNCDKGIDYNVETGQLIISKLPDDVVTQLKELFGDIEPLESAKRSDDEIMGKDLRV
ncbi:hypothetical protein [Aliivibrio salmonicida]|uniref:hypothetical protein n=1 Tax=Aliivibrio salmonicida TaxID=40269 RepID=UPI003D0ED99A